MDIQHQMAVKIADFVDSGKGEETEESVEQKLLLIYGIEVFLNEFLKMAVVLACGIFLGEVPLTLYAMVFLMLLRRYAGGKHFESNLICFCVTWFSLVPVPIIGKTMAIPVEVMIPIGMIEVILLLIYAPSKADEDYTRKQQLILKAKTMIVYGIGLLGSWFCGGIEYLRAMMLVALVVAITAIRIKK